MSGKMFACRGIAEVSLKAHEVQVASVSSAGLAQSPLPSLWGTEAGWSLLTGLHCPRLAQGGLKTSIYSSLGHALHSVCPKLRANKEAFGPISPPLKQSG